MSTRPKHEPAVPDRLPGEEDMARLYQQTADEQPPEALDALVLAAARRAAQPRLRVVKGKGGRISQMTRRWAIPLSLAATLVVTIGVVTSLKEDIGRPLMSVQSEEPRTVSASSREMRSAQSQDQETRRDARQKAKQLALSTLAEDASDLKDAAASPQPKMDALVFSAPQAVPPTAQAPTPMTSELREAKKEKQSVAKPLRQEKRRRNERNAALLGKAEEDADTALVAPVPAQEAMPQEELESKLTDARTEQWIGGTGMRGPRISARPPKDWLAEIDQLFQAGKRREAEDSLRAFQKEHPDYTDYPDSFPADVLERLQKRTLSEKPASRE